MRVLLVKLSSLGDVIHNLPVATDLAQALPGIEIDWLTEAPYADLVALHPAVRNVYPVHLRHLKKHWWSAAAWHEWQADRRRVGVQTYHLVLDTQGLVKSAWVARWAGAPISGYAAASAREPLAARFYAQRFDVPRDLHAVVRNRQLAAQAFGYELTKEIDYGLRAAPPAPNWLPATPFAVFLHGTSRADKLWPQAHWIALGRELNARGMQVLLPWGSAAERAVAENLAGAIPQASVAPAMSLVEAAGMLSRAAAVIGVDTGLAHLAVALQRPTVGIYLTTSPRLTGLAGGANAVNLGDGSPAQPDCPPVDAVLAALLPLMNESAST
ncbi:MAG: lipopolysaccharide heptosyltransferase I [Betaproteobacteria bacterium]|nr:lipopolysaccharide heptosyltransferase I [Betaproteobacteria bacterium]